MKKINYFKRFFLIEHACVYVDVKDCNTCLRGKKDRELISYHHVISVYVFSINKHWDGTDAFDVCPVDFSKKVNKDKSWRWKREFKNSEINKGELFEDIKKVKRKYNKLYTKENRQRYKELNKINDEQKASQT